MKNLTDFLVENEIAIDNGECYSIIENKLHIIEKELNDIMNNPYDYSVAQLKTLLKEHQAYTSVLEVYKKMLRNEI